MTLQNAPPGLDYERDKKFSKVVQILSAYYQIWASSMVNYHRLCSSFTFLSRYFQLCSVI